MFGRWGETPLVAVTTCLALGISAATHLRHYSFQGLACAGFLLLCAAALSFRRDRLRTSLALGLSTIALCGLLLALAHRDGYPKSDVRALLDRGLFPLDESSAFEGCVVEESQRRSDEMVATVRLRAIRKGDSWQPCHGNCLVRTPAAPEGDLPNAQGLHFGDRVRGWAVWRLPRNYQNPGSKDYVGGLSRRGITVVGRVKSARILEVIPGDCSDPWGSAAVGVRDRLRAGLEDLARSGKEREAAILASVVIGDYSGLDTPTREAFQNTGTYHVLVVSGLHVAWMAWVLVRIFQFLRVPGQLGRVLSAAGVFFYTCVVGFQASITRCLWMFILYLVGQGLFRRAAPTNILFASALILLSARPDLLVDAGFQLSVLSVLAICQMAVPLTGSKLVPVFWPLRYAGDPERLFLDPGRWQRFGRRLRFRCELAAEAAEDAWGPRVSRRILQVCRCSSRVAFILAETILVSLCVQIWLEMLLACHFNRLSWISPLANIVAVPASSLALAAGLGAAILSNVRFLAHPALTGAGFLASFLVRSNEWLATIPAAWQRCPTPSAWWVLAMILLLFAWCFLGWKRLWVPCLLVEASLGIIAVGRIPVPNLRAVLPGRACPSRELRITCLDVGEGDSIVVRLPNGAVWIVDAGGIHQPYTPGVDAAFDVGEAVVSRYLWQEWIGRLNRLVISHPDADHAGGAQSLLRNFRTSELVYGEEAVDTQLGQILVTARAQHVLTRRVAAGEQMSDGGVVVQILNPPQDTSGRSTNENSVVLRLVYGNFSALLTGDLEKSAETDLLTRSNNVRSLLLKAAHHGSRSATSDLLLERVGPRWAVLSASRNNPFGHPSTEVLMRLQHHGARPLLTLDHGAVTITTDGRRYSLSSYLGGELERGTLAPDAGLRSQPK